jgi:hypothetical protein
MRRCLVLRNSIRIQALEWQHRTIQVHVSALQMSISFFQAFCVCCVATLKVLCNCCRCMHSSGFTRQALIP